MVQWCPMVLMIWDTTYFRIPPYCQCFFERAGGCHHTSLVKSDWHANMGFNVWHIAEFFFSSEDLIITSLSQNQLEYKFIGIHLCQENVLYCKWESERHCAPHRLAEGKIYLDCLLLLFIVLAVTCFVCCCYLLFLRLVFSCLVVHSANGVQVGHPLPTPRGDGAAYIFKQKGGNLVDDVERSLPSIVSSG